MTGKSNTKSAKVLVVDDSRITRSIIAAILNSDPGLEVVGEAADGAEAVQLATELKPDVITMDINMPNMNGHEATRQIMARSPTPIVVVTSVSRIEQVYSGLDILLAGALEIVQKPGSLTKKGYQSISQELVDKVKAVASIIVNCE